MPCVNQMITCEGTKLEVLTEDEVIKLIEEQKVYHVLGVADPKKCIRIDDKFYIQTKYGYVEMMRG